MVKPVSAAPIPAPGQGKRGTEGHLGHLLRQAAAAHRLRLERVLARLGVTPPQFLVLTMLAAYSGASNADLARLTFLTPQTTMVIVRNLLRSGLVARGAHAVHGRIRPIALTRAGQALLARCRERAAATERRLVAELPTTAEGAVRRWLVAVAA